MRMRRPKLPPGPAPDERRGDGARAACDPDYASAMSALLIITYDVSDADRYAEYNPGSLGEIMATVGKHGGQPVAAGPPDVVTGSMEHTAVCISFPDADAAKAWLDDDDYAPLKAIRYESTSNIREYVVPGFG